jgi:glyoxylase-like metal-dependent hydrolase (beta-lactamase superfamily II)/ferredoxin
MADITKLRSENIKGNFFVDSDCISCGACYWIAPENFCDIEGYSAVFNQPNDEHLEKAYQALLSCPVNSIGTKENDPIISKIMSELPFKIDGDVYHCGFHSKESYGATSYFIKNETGNILIDSPRYVSQLSRAFGKLGGVSTYALTHIDDIADTDIFWNDFKGKRYLHEGDINEKTKHYEVHMKGIEYFNLTDDLLCIPVPGHTKGSVCFLYKNKYLFTGDHLAFSKELGHLYAFKNHCWYDYETQVKSMERLLEFDFEYVLPGHGRPFKANREEMKESLKKCISWMKEG